jgi:hypothetical protein
VLLCQQGEQTGDGGGLAGAGPAGEDSGPPGDCGLGDRSLLGIVGADEQPVESGRKRGVVDRGRGVAQPSQHVVADRALLAPVAVEVEPRALQSEQLVGDDAASRDLLDPGCRLGPGQIGLLVVEGHLVGTQEVETDRAVTHCAHRQGRGEEDVRLGLAHGRAEPFGDVDVGGDEDARLVEGGERAGGGECEPLVVPVVDHVITPGSTGLPASSSDRAITSAAGGRQENTPHGTPSTTGVSGPHMPRTKR